MLRYPRLPFLLGLLCAVGCCGTPQIEDLPEAEVVKSFADARPAIVPPESLNIVAILAHPDRPAHGSGVVVAPDLIVTAKHVIDMLPRNNEGSVLARVGDRSLAFRVLAESEEVRPTEDWAILTPDDATRFRGAATIDPRARRADWRPKDETPILLAGFASGFFDGATEVESVPALVGSFWGGEDPRAWRIEVGPYDLGGLSGGGIFLWDPVTGEPSLIAVHHGRRPAVVTTTVALNFLGLEWCLSSKSEPQVLHQVSPLPAELFELLDARAAQSP